MSNSRSKNQFETLYRKEKLSLREIGKRLGIKSSSNVLKCFKKYDIPRRPMGFQKGNVPWHKGLTKNTDERLKRMAERKRGQPLSKTHRNKISQALRGNKRRVGIKPANAFPKGYIPTNKGKKGWGVFVKLNKDPEFTKHRLQGLLKRPTKPEKRVIETVRKYHLPYTYVGDGRVIIEGTCPDFINNNGAKRIIEVFGDYWHRNSKRYIATEKGRRELFSKYGFNLLILWESQIDKISDLEIARVIEKFEVEA